MNDFKDYLAHHGILGMKWGIRRFRNYDGSLTNAGRKRYDSPGNLRYKKAAKEQEARKEKRRTRAKQIAKGLAAAALTGGIGYAAYKLSKKAPALARYMRRNASNDNPTNGPIIVNKKTGQVITDPNEVRRIEELIDARLSAGLDLRTGKKIEQSKPPRVNVNKVEPNRVPINKVEPNRASVNRVNVSDIFMGDDGDHQRFQEFMTNPKYKDATLYFDGKMPTDERSKRRIAKHISRQVEKLEGEIDREGKEIAKAKKAARKISDGLSEAEEKLRRRK